MSSSNVPSINNPIQTLIFPDSMLDKITYGPMTDIGYPGEAGHPMSCKSTQYTLGSKTLSILDKHPFTRQPINRSEWNPNRGLQDAIEEFIGNAHIQATIPVSQVVISSPDQADKIMVFFIDTSGSMGLCVDKKPMGESGTREITRLDEVIWILIIWIKWLRITAPNTKIAIVSFNNEPVLLCNRIVTLNTQEACSLLYAEIKKLTPGGGTQLLGSMHKMLAKISTYKPTRLELVVFTDGEFDSIPFGIEAAYKGLVKSHPIKTITFFAIGEGINVNQIDNLCGIQNTFHENSSRVLGLYGSKFAATIAGTYIITCNTPRIKLDPICLTILSQTVCFLTTQVKYPVNTGESAKLALTEFAKFLNKKKGESVESDKLIASLTYELEGGEIYQAFQPTNFANWGRLYILSIKESYKNGYPLNAGPVDSRFHTQRDTEYLEELQELIIVHGNIVPTGNYITSPSAGPVHNTATIQSAATVQVNSSGQVTVYSSYDSGSCSFGPNTILPLPHFIRPITITDLYPGLYVYTSDKQQIVAIRKVIDTIGQLDLHQLSDTVCMSPYHPVDMPGKGWDFPYNITKETVTSSHRYSIILDPLDINGMPHNYTILLDGGISAITLGHGRKDGILDHPFFANIDKVTETYSHLTGWEQGLIQVYSKDANVTRDPVTESVTMVQYPKN